MRAGFGVLASVPDLCILFTFTGVYKYFFIFAIKHKLRVLVRSGSNVYSQSMICGNSLEPPRGGSNMYPQPML